MIFCLFLQEMYSVTIKIILLPINGSLEVITELQVASYSSCDDIMKRHK